MHRDKAAITRDVRPCSESKKGGARDATRGDVPEQGNVV